MYTYDSLHNYPDVYIYSIFLLAFLIALRYYVRVIQTRQHHQTPMLGQ